MKCSMFVMNNCMFSCLSAMVWCEYAMSKSIFVRVIPSVFLTQYCAGG
jgi:hypothetical protein